MYCTVLLGLQNFLTVYSPRFPAARHAPRFCQLKSKEDSAWSSTKFKEAKHWTVQCTVS